MSALPVKKTAIVATPSPSIDLKDKDAPKKKSKANARERKTEEEHEAAVVCDSAKYNPYTIESEYVAELKQKRLEKILKRMPPPEERGAVFKKFMEEETVQRGKFKGLTYREMYLENRQYFTWYVQTVLAGENDGEGLEYAIMINDFLALGLTLH